jgi:hypothetical protein
MLAGMLTPWPVMTLGRRPATATSVSPAQMPQIGPPKSMSRHRVRGEDAVECLAGMGHPGCS